MKETPIRLILTLTIVCAASAALVASVGVATARPVAAAKARAKAESLRQVLPPDAPEPVEKALLAPDGTTNFTYYAAGDAIALEVHSEHGYGGLLRLLVGFDAEGRLQGFTVLEHSETPGLGAKLANPDNPVLASARGLPAAETDWRVRKDGGAVDAITAATISSRAACEAIAQAAARLAEIKAQP